MKSARFTALLACLWYLLLHGLVVAVAVPTSRGDGADAYLTNDSNRGPTVTHGTKAFLEIKQIPNSRLRIAYLRFDITGLAGSMNGATISLYGTSVPDDLPLAVYGLHENPVAGAGEFWDETQINYATASGLDASAALGTYAFSSDTTATALAATTGSGNGWNATVPNPALDDFLAADTNGVVTFIVVIDPAATAKNNALTFSSKEGSFAPVLTLPYASVPPTNDIDGDGLEDLWEDAHFGNANGVATNAELALQSGTDDADGDGFNNEMEETAQTDPNDPQAFPGGPAFFYVATDGDDANTGTIDAPFATIARAQQAAEPGTTVYFRGGAYHIDVGQVAEYSSIFARVFLMDKSGTETAPIRYWAYPGETSVIDMSAVNPTDYRIYTFYITADWLHFRGLVVTGVQVNILTHTQSICFDNEGSHNIYERLVMHDNQAIGMWIGNGSNNLVLNCDAFRNWDYTSEGGVGGNVDGFGCHASAGEGNVFRGCRAWFNSDDGFDLITATKPVVIEQCWAFYNGYDYNFVSRGDGNGFKAGGYGSTAAASLPNPIPRHVVRDSFAIKNKASGFYANHHPGGLTFEGNTGLRNGANFNMLCRLADNITDVPGYDHMLHNNLGYLGSNQLTNVDLAACVHDHNFFDLPVTVASDDFLSNDEALHTTARQASGELPVVPLMRLAPSSDLLDQGADIGLPYAGSAPDLGCFERDMIELGNHAFDKPAFAQSITRPAGMVWEFAGEAGVRQAGTQVAYVAGGGRISQRCDGYEPGEVYRVRVASACPAGSAVLAVEMDGSVVQSLSIASSSTADYDVYVVASATSHTLGFVGPADEVQLSAVEVSRVTATDDADADGFADAWEVLTFGSLAESPTSDFDGDGSSNSLELALGLDATSGAEFFHCSISQGGVLTWPGAAGSSFAVWRSTDLTTWQKIADVPGASPTTSYTDPAPPLDRAFYRVSLILP